MASHKHCRGHLTLVSCLWAWKDIARMFAFCLGLFMSFVFCCVASVCKHAPEDLERRFANTNVVSPVSHSMFCIGVWIRGSHSMN